jgi:hypothetical protein
MALDAWLPVGYKLPDGVETHITLFDGANWQILQTQGCGRALVALDELLDDGSSPALSIRAISLPSTTGRSVFARPRADLTRSFVLFPAENLRTRKPKPFRLLWH